LGGFTTYSLLPSKPKFREAASAPLVHKQLGTVQRDGGVRFSIGAFNSEQEVDAAIAGIADISQWARERAAKSQVPDFQVIENK
jgi:hypothetical protein